MVKATTIAICIDSSLLLAKVFDNGVHSSRSGHIDKLEKILLSKNTCLKPSKKKLKIELRK